MYKLKKVTALTLATAMVFGSSLTVLAADSSSGGHTGSGKMEGLVKMDVFDVELPTVAADSIIYNFILDPIGLIDKTNAAKYPDSKFEDDATIFFQSATQVDGKTAYNSKSDTLEVKNRSSIAVDVAVTAKMISDSMKGIEMTGDKTFTDDTKASIYLALMDEDGEQPILAEGGATLSKSIDAAPDDAYTIVSTAEGYKNELTTAAKDPGYTGFETYSFQLTGACNAGGTWNGLDTAKPEVEVVWNVKSSLVPDLASDGTTDIVLEYVGAKPSKVLIYPVNTTGPSTQPMTMSHGADVEIGTTTVTLKAAFIQKIIDNKDRGAGTYKTTINGQDYEITIIG